MARLLVTVLLILTQPSYADYPGDSIYLLESEWRNQDSEQLRLGDLAGKTLVLSMTYTSCQHTCPTIVSNMQEIEKRLLDSDRGKVMFVIVSLLPEHDTPDVLKAYAAKRGLEGWTLLSGQKEDIRMLAMVLNVRYKAVGESEVSHSNLITILDDLGSVKQQITGTALKADFVLEHLGG